VVATATTAASAAVAGRRAAARRSAALELVGGLVAELRAGQETRSALVAAATAAALPEVAAAARSPASSPVAALDAAGRLPGGDLLRDLAATWRAGEVTGDALATAVGRLAAGARADEAVRRELAAAVAGPRSTMHLLCVLPAFGLLLGGALGADPLGFLVGSTVGQAVLLAGVALVAAGSAWTRALLGRAEGP